MKIAVVGTGYVGLVTSTCLAESGNEVVGVDKDAQKVQTLEAGRLPLSRRPLDLNEMLHEVASRYRALPNARRVRFSEGLSDEQKSQLSENPAGMVELSDEELGNAEGAITPIIIGSLISLNYAVWSSIC